MSDSPIFIVGCERSGTTLLRDLLRSHPRLTFPLPSHFIPAFYRAYGDPRSERQARRLAARILDFPPVRLWTRELSLTPDAFAEDRSYRQIVCRIYEAWARSEGKPRWGDKTTRYVAAIPVLVELFPTAKIVHIYRDGRDVALSWSRAPFPHPGNLFATARTWKALVNAGRRAGAGLPESYLEVRYETLLELPEETMEGICAFLGEPFSESVLKPSRMPLEGVFRDRPVSETEIVGANVAKWKSELSRSDRVLFESVAGDLLESLGYETEGLARPITRSEELMWTADRAFRWVLQKARRQGDERRVSPLRQLWWARLRGRLTSRR